MQINSIDPEALAAFKPLYQKHFGVYPDDVVLESELLVLLNWLSTCDDGKASTVVTVEYYGDQSTQ